MPILPKSFSGFAPLGITVREAEYVDIFRLIVDPFSANLDSMGYIKREAMDHLERALARGKSALLLGPSQPNPSAAFRSLRKMETLMINLDAQVNGHSAGNCDRIAEGIRLSQIRETRHNAKVPS
jgi:hypothetical protein